METLPPEIVNLIYYFYIDSMMDEWRTSHKGSFEKVSEELKHKTFPISITLSFVQESKIIGILCNNGRWGLKRLTGNNATVNVILYNKNEQSVVDVDVTTLLPK